MCGIFGYNFKDGTISSGRRAILGNNLARLNDKRGGHSWGVCSIENGSTDINRGLGDMADHAWHLADATFVMGHTRYATIGAKTVENAHPFEIDDIIGAHNGGVTNHHELDKKYKRNTTVDSQHLFYHLNEDRSFSDIEGYGAIEWLKKSELEANVQRVFLSKLKGGMLAIFGIGDPAGDKSDGVVWSSDEKHLLEALYNAGIENFYPYKVEEGSIFYIQNGEVFIDHHKKADLGKEVHRKGQQSWEGSYNYGVSTRHSYSGTGTSTGKTGTGTTTGKSDSFASPHERDLTDWKEWNLYCEEREGESVVDDNTNGEQENCGTVHVPCGLATCDANSADHSEPCTCGVSSD